MLQPHATPPGSSLAPRLELMTIPAGTVTMPASAEHRVRVHAGPPTRGHCRHQRFHYARGVIDVCPAGVADEWQQLDPSTSLVLSLSEALLRRAAEAVGQDPARARVPERCEVRDPQIEHIAWALEADQAAGCPGGALFAESLGLALALRLMGRAERQPRPPRGLTPAQLRRVTAYIEEHLDRDLSLATLAEVVGLSVSHLKTQFRRSLGVPVHTYVIQRRVERARSLLLRGSLPASQVALVAGFSHQSHMARCMRRVLGVTPTALARATAG